VVQKQNVKLGEMNNIYCTVYTHTFICGVARMGTASNLGFPAVAMIALKCNENIEMKLSRDSAKTEYLAGD